MRLWHKDLIPYLPRKQLLGQWRECCAIAKRISEKGTPGHILVNKIMEYPLEDFFTYGMAVCAEMKKRGYGPTQNAIADFTKHILDHDEKGAQYIDLEEVFFLWHTPRYFMQCFYNLEEKYDCGGITPEEWDKILFYTKDPIYKNHCKALRDDELREIHPEYLSWKATGVIPPKTRLSVLRVLYRADDTSLLQMELDYLREYIDRDIKRKGE